jgi:hypothetical protein
MNWQRKDGDPSERLFRMTKKKKPRSNREKMKNGRKRAFLESDL